MAYLKGILAAAAGILAFGCTASAAAATISLSPGGNISMTANNTVTFTSGGSTSICPFTMSGTLATSAIASAGTNTQVGSRTSGSSVTTCTGSLASSMALLINTTPWPIQYKFVVNGLTMTQTFTIQGMKFLLQTAFVSCLYQVDLPVASSATVGVPTTFTAGPLQLSTVNATLASGAGCPSTVTMTGGALTLVPTQTIRVTQ